MKGNTISTRYAHDCGKLRLQRGAPVAAASWNLKQRCCNGLSAELEPRCGMLQWHPRRAGIGSRPHAMIRHVVVQPAIFFARTSLFLLEPTFLPQLQRARRAICYDQSFSLLEPSVFFAGTKFLQELRWRVAFLIFRCICVFLLEPALDFAGTV